MSDSLSEAIHEIFVVFLVGKRRFMDSPIKKIKIKVNGKLRSVYKDSSALNVIKNSPTIS